MSLPHSYSNSLSRCLASLSVSYLSFARARALSLSSLSLSRSRVRALTLSLSPSLPLSFSLSLSFSLCVCLSPQLSAWQGTVCACVCLVCVNTSQMSSIHICRSVYTKYTSHAYARALSPSCTHFQSHKYQEAEKAKKAAKTRPSKAEDEDKKE